MSIKKHVMNLVRHQGTLWNVLKSPKTIALIKLSVALVGVVHAIDEFTSASSAKKQIGFKVEDEKEKNSF